MGRYYSYLNLFHFWEDLGIFFVSHVHVCMYPNKGMKVRACITASVSSKRVRGHMLTRACIRSIRSEISVPTVPFEPIPFLLIHSEQGLIV